MMNKENRTPGQIRHELLHEIRDLTAELATPGAREWASYIEVDPEIRGALVTARNFLRETVARIEKARILGRSTT